MSDLNLEDILTNVYQGEVIDNIVLPKMEEIYALFGQNTNYKEGSNIKDANAVTETANGGAFTRSDADPSSLTRTWANPEWVKTYYHEAADIRAEDIDEMLGSQAGAMNVLGQAAESATRQLMNTHVFSGVFTQIKADVDSAADYSDGNAVTRVTALQSYEENTDTTITLAIWRAMWQAIYLRGHINWNEYIGIFEPTVWNSFFPLADALVTKTRMNPSMTDVNAAGYQEIDSVDGIRVAPVYGMTVGDVFLLNRNDVQIQNHKALELTLRTPKELGAYQYRVVARIGVRAWVRRPRFQGKLTLKD
jgi:hypothetical protein